MSPEESEFPNGGSVRIGLADVYREVVALRDQVGVLAALSVTVTDHEQRLRKTERIMWMALGVAAASPVIVGIVL